MKTNISQKFLPVYEALASNVRINIINLLAENPLNIKQLASELKLSSAIVTMHVKKLEAGGLIETERVKLNGSIQKLCRLCVDKLEVEFPKPVSKNNKFYETEIAVGHFTDFNIQPTCGLATSEATIGYYDDPRSFLEPNRINANILWFSKGYVEYKIPNYLLSNQTPKELELSMELCSEAPGINNNWPSDISFIFNGTKIAQWTSPGDFGGKRGKFTPDWWSLYVAQFGFLKIIKVNSEGTFVDGKMASAITINDLNIREKMWTFQIAVLEDATNIGGVTIFGKNFGNYNQDINVKLYYS